MITTHSLSSTTTTRRSTRSATRIGSRRTMMWTCGEQLHSDEDEATSRRRIASRWWRSASWTTPTGFRSRGGPRRRLADRVASRRCGWRRCGWRCGHTREPCHLIHSHLSHYVLRCVCTPTWTCVRQYSLRTCRTLTYETYDQPYAKLDVVRVVRCTTPGCLTYGPP